MPSGMSSSSSGRLKNAPGAGGPGSGGTLTDLGGIGEALSGMLADGLGLPLEVTANLEKTVGL